jgi:hypothetical protein
MTEQMAFALASASVGFVAAICFCIGSAFLSKNKIVILAATYWDYNEAHANAIISQSAQYITGAILLAIAFGLQVAAIRASQATVRLPHPVLEHVFAFVLVVLLASGLIAFVLYGLLMLRKKSILRELKKR